MSTQVTSARKSAPTTSVARKTAPSAPVARKSAQTNKTKSLETNQTAELTDRLLALRRHGRPPFLVRNLRYVALDKARARRRLWDLAWGSANVRAAHTPRHLVLRVSPRRCILEKGATAQLLHPGRALQPISPGERYVPLKARCRIWLSVKQPSGAYVSFGLRNFKLRIWPKEHLVDALQLWDFAIQETFDLSAAIALLGSFPAALTLIVEIFSHDSGAKIANTSVSRLRGELCLLDRDVDDNTVVPNGKVRVPLYFTASDAGEIPMEAARPRLGFVPPNVLRREDIHHEDGLLPEEDVVMVEELEDPGNMGDIDDEETRRPAASSSKLKLKQKAKEIKADKPIGNSSSRSPDAHIVLELEGTVQDAVQELQSENKPRIHVTMWYSSQALPFWDGIVRHDFVCPWCHRNCYRFRTLLAHFQVEHDEMEFGVEGMSNMPGTQGDGKQVPIVFRLEVTPVPQEKITSRSEGEAAGSDEEPVAGWEDVYANQRRFRGYMNPGPPKRSADEVQTAMERVKISDDDHKDDDTESTDSEEEHNKDFLAMVNEDLWQLCKMCQHRRKEPAPDNQSRGAFCSEYCEMIYRKKMAEGNTSDEGNVRRRNLPPLLSYSTKPRPKSVDYKETLGKLELYHIVSVCRAKEEHFDEDDPDSEEEVDSSWRLDLALERVRHLDDATPKEKLLFMMWNKFAHENYPIPSVYGERYTRFTVELFALEYGPQIHKLKLRLQLFGFLRALHIHGLIDSVAIISIMQCLDGKKKRRDINVSSRPDEPNTSAGPATSSRGKTSGRGRRGRGGRR